MSKTTTKTKTEEKTEVEVKTSTKVIALIRAAAEATAKQTAAFFTLALGIRAEAKANDYDEEQARKMVTLSYREAFGIEGEKEIATFDLKMRPDVSKVLRLAFPVNAKAVQNLEQAQKHNEKAQNGDRIGVNNLLEIARNNKTFAEVIGHKRAKKAAGGTKTYALENFRLDFQAIVGRALKAHDYAKVEKVVEEVLAEKANKEEKE